MNRFLLFVFDPKKPKGGWGDFVEDFADLKAAQKAAKQKHYHIVDLEDGRIIEKEKTI